MADRASDRVPREAGMGSVMRVAIAGIAQAGGSQRAAGPDTEFTRSVIGFSSKRIKVLIEQVPAEGGSPVAAQDAAVAGGMAVVGEKDTRNRAEGNQDNQVARVAVAGFRLVRSNHSTTSRM